MFRIFQLHVVLLLTLVSGSVALAEVAIAPVPEVSIESTASPRPIPLRIIVVHWKIKPGKEADFLSHWSTRSVVGDRSGLVSEYLSSVEARGRAPWITWQTLRPEYTSYFNVGVWRDLNAFQDQIGRYIDDSRALLPFEAERRERVLLAPEAWRTGRSILPMADAPGVK